MVALFLNVVATVIIYYYGVSDGMLSELGVDSRRHPLVRHFVALSDIFHLMCGGGELVKFQIQIAPQSG